MPVSDMVESGWLSSGGQPVATPDSVLEIRVPCRIEAAGAGLTFSRFGRRPPMHAERVMDTFELLFVRQGALHDVRRRPVI